MNDLVFPVLGYRVSVSTGFALLAGVLLLFGLQAGQTLPFILGAVAVLFVSILVHELGHAVVATRLGLRVYGIHIHGFGGHVLHEPGSDRRQLAVSLAGPGAGLALGLPLLAVLMLGRLEAVPGAATDLLVYAVLINVGWSLFNLLPMLPLDGGNALSSLLVLTMGARGRRIAARVGVGCGAAVAVLALLADETWVMLIGGFCAYTSYQVLQRLTGRA